MQYHVSDLNQQKHEPGVCLNQEAIAQRFARSLSATANAWINNLCFMRIPSVSIIIKFI